MNSVPRSEDSRNLTFTLVPSTYVHVGAASTLRWRDWSEWLTTHEITTDRKDWRTGFVPGAMPCRGAQCRLKHAKNLDASDLSDAYQSDAHVTHLEAIVFDFEAPDDADGNKRGVPTDAVHEIVDSFGRHAFAAYTSASKSVDHDEHRFRVVAPLNRRVQPAEWRDVWLACVHAFGRGYADRSCANRSRYYVAPTKFAREMHHWSESQEGPWVDVNAVLAKYTREVPAKARAAATHVACVEAGVNGDFLGAIALLPDLTDGRWQAVRSLAFRVGKFGAISRWDLTRTLRYGLGKFEAALAQCDLSERNPFDKLMRTAEACIENGWHVRGGELAAEYERLERLITRTKGKR